jgi:prepilin-type N-terminal cleavage/methylation domain-containing protein
MGVRGKSAKRGFSLLEMVVAIGLGTLVLAAATQLYTQGVNATWTVSQQAEMQQDFRAASGMLTRDLSLAGAGLGNNVQIALPTGTGTLPVYGCDQSSPTKCYLNGKSGAFPTQSSVSYLYGLIPGNQLGPQLNPSQPATDIVTVAYTDANFLVNLYCSTVTSSTTVRFTVPGTSGSATCKLMGTSAPQALDDPVVGLTAGDLLFFSVTGGGPGATYSPVIAEVTSVAAKAGTVPNQYYDVTFAKGDPLQMNQTTATSGALVNAVNWTGTASRLLLITYYIDGTPNPPRLMRMVSGHTPVPVAEGVVFLQFSYDLYDSSSGTIYPGQPDGGASLGMTPDQITKTNIVHMAMDPTLKGIKGEGQGLDLETSVSERDLTYVNSYPPTQ